MSDISRESILKNPSLILSDQEIMEALINFSQKNSANVVDLRDVFIKKMYKDLEDLSIVHKSTLTAAYDNFMGVSILHKAILFIIKQSTIVGLLNALSEEVTSLLQLDAIKLCIFEKDRAVNSHPVLIKMKEGDALKYLNPKERNSIYSVSLREVLGSEDWFDYKANREKKIRSEAILWLKMEDPLEEAILVFGSTKRKTFLPSMKTDHLKFFAEVFSRQFLNLKTQLKQNAK